MNRAVAGLNIEHFRKVLAVETDEVKRQELLYLLAEEEAKLAAFDHLPKRRKQPD